MRASKTKNSSQERRARAVEPESPPRVVVLAAGVGSRMRSTLPKVLHRIGGRTLLDAVLDTAGEISPSQVVVVIGAGREQVEKALSGRPVTVVVQDPPLGTGDAVRRALPALSGDGSAPVVVLSGDAPLLTAATADPVDRSPARKGPRSRVPELSTAGRRRPRARRARREGTRPTHRRGAQRHGPRAAPGRGERRRLLLRGRPPSSAALSRLAPNPVNGEFYLTDAVASLASKAGAVEAVEAEDWREGWGINTRRELAAAEEIERRRCLDRAFDAGATIVDPATTRVGARVRFEPDAVVHPFVCLDGDTLLEQGCEVLPFTRITDSTVGPGAVVGPHCDVEGAQIGPRARVGPFARLRPGTVLEEDVRVGNFVETKQATLHAGAKASHLSYLGDAEIGAGANIGAGVITCNYDGERKHRTSIGEGAFIGSDSQLVAPVTVGSGAYVGAGSTITRDVPDGALAVTRVPQKNLPGWAAKRTARRKKA